MLLVPIPWAARTWALPVVTALAPSERYNRTHHRRHKTVTDWARQLLLVVRRWWPDRPLVAVADSSYATLPLLGGNTSAVRRQRARRRGAARSVPAVSGSDRSSGVASARASGVQACDEVDLGCSRRRTR